MKIIVIKVLLKDIKINNVNNSDSFFQLVKQIYNRYFLKQMTSTNNVSAKKKN